MPFCLLHLYCIPETIGEIRISPRITSYFLAGPLRKPGDSLKHLRKQISCRRLLLRLIVSPPLPEIPIGERYTHF